MRSVIRGLPSPVKVGTFKLLSATKFLLSIGPGRDNFFKTVPELLETPELEAILQLCKTYFSNKLCTNK